jgi:hypothetical protein
MRYGVGRVNTGQETLSQRVGGMRRDAGGVSIGRGATLP